MIMKDTGRIGRLLIDLESPVIKGWWDKICKLVRLKKQTRMLTTKTAIKMTTNCPQCVDQTILFSLEK